MKSTKELLSNESKKWFNKTTALADYNSVPS